MSTVDRDDSGEKEDCHGNPPAHRSRDEVEESPLSEVRRSDQFTENPLQTLSRTAATAEKDEE
jgi:hypothetical protein